MIRLAELLSEDSVRLEVPMAEKFAVIEEMVAGLMDEGIVEDAKQTLEDIRAREDAMSTGIGDGIAVPHARSAGVGRLGLAIFRMESPIEFESLDERPVSLMFLVVGPESDRGVTRVLARIGRMLYSGDLKRNLLRARSPQEVLEQIRIEEARILG